MPYSSGAVATVSSGPVSYKMPVPSTHSRYISGSSSRPSYSLSSSLDRPLYSSLSRTVPRSTSYTDYRSEYKSKYASPSRTLSSSYTRQGSLSDDSSTTRSSVGTRERSVETRERKNSTTSTTTTTTTTLGRRFGTSSSTLAGISVTEMFSKYSPSSYSPSTTSSYSPARYTSSRSAPGGKVNNNEQDDDNGNVPIAEIRRRFDGASLQNGARSSPSPVVARKVYNVTEALSSSEDEDEEEEDEEEEEEKEMTSRRTDSPAGGVAGGAGSGIRRISPAKLQPSSETESNVVSLSPSPRLARTRGNVSNSRDRGGLAGLRNIGNTCFMNSVIQCLSNTKPLLEYLLTDQFMSEINPTVSSMKGALINAFSTVIHELWRPESEDSVVNTTALKSQIQRFAPRFMGYSQQDAQEFLRYLLEGLHEDVNRVTVKPKPILTDVDDSFSDQQRAAESWKRYLRMDDSKVVDIFVGQLKSTLRCTSCGHCSVTFDPFWDLSLPIPARTGQLKLQQCFDHFTREEVLDGDEKPTCSKCQVRRKCTKSFTIQKFPKILVLHLKRFSPMERFRGKLNVTVDFPLTGLDLSAYAANRGQGCMYNLYGVANHSGTTYSGHYTAYCKHPYTGDWHEYNDSRVSSISSRSVVSSEAYVLFFELSGHSSHL